MVKSLIQQWQESHCEISKALNALNLNYYVLNIVQESKALRNSKWTRKQIQQAESSQQQVANITESSLELDQLMYWLLSQAEQHDYTGQQVNGYFSMCRLLNKLVDTVCNQLIKVNQSMDMDCALHKLQNTAIIMRFFVELVRQMHIIFSQSESSNSNSTNSILTDFNATNSSQTDSRRSDSNQTDCGKIDSNQIDSNPTNSSQINFSQINSSQINSKRIDSTRIDYNQIDLNQINSSQTDFAQTKLFQQDNPPQHNIFLCNISSFALMNNISCTKQAQNALKLLYGKNGVFWYCESMQIYFKMFRLILIGSTCNPLRTLKCVFNQHYAGKTIARKCANSTLQYVTRSLGSIEFRIYNRAYFSLLNIRSSLRYSCSTICIKLKTRFLVPQQANQQIQMLDEPGEERVIRCRFLTGYEKNFQKKIDKNDLNTSNQAKFLLFHVHGGGFVVTSPDSHEIYLRKWATKLNGIPIVSVDYTLKAKYPCAIQDVLDIYLEIFGLRHSPDNIHLQNNQSSKIQKIFGFIPEQVILVGDSCGGNLIMSLLCCLNDIRKRYEFVNLRLPFALTAIYPIFDLRAVCSPSKFIGALDPILHSGNLMAMHGCYGGLNPDAHKINTLASRIRNRHPDAWFTNNKKQVDEQVLTRFKQMHHTLETVYASPAIYNHYEDFRHISLHLIGSHICPLLDDSVQMYRRWTGPASFQVFDGIPHGFIQFVDLSSACKKATKQCFQTILNAINARLKQLQNKSSLDHNQNHQNKLNNNYINCNDHNNNQNDHNNHNVLNNFINKSNSHN